MEFPWLVMLQDFRKPTTIYPIAGCMSEALCNQFIIFYRSQIMIPNKRTKMYAAKNHAYKEQVG